MRDPRAAFRPYLIRQTEEAREKLAAALFDRDAVRLAMTEAALRGEGAVRLSLGDGSADLRGTDAARGLVAWCQGQGLSTEWAERVVERPNGLKVRTAELIIAWGDEQHTG